MSTTATTSNNNSNNNNNNNNNNMRGSIDQKWAESKMAKRNKVTESHSAEVAALYQKAEVSGAKLLELFPQYSKASIMDDG